MQTIAGIKIGTKVSIAHHLRAPVDWSSVVVIVELCHTILCLVGTDKAGRGWMLHNLLNVDRKVDYQEHVT